MNLKVTVLMMKVLVKHYVLKGITSQEGVRVEWPIQEGENITEQYVYIGGYSFTESENGCPSYVVLPKSFDTAIPDGEFCHYTADQLAEELSKRFVRNFLTGIGVNPNAVTRHWYGK